jgi:hypothetical protein
MAPEVSTAVRKLPDAPPDGQPAAGSSPNAHPSWLLPKSRLPAFDKERPLLDRGR